MVCWYESATITNNPVTAAAIGRAQCSATAPAATSTSRISSVAYAVDEMASEAKTGSAIILESLVRCSSAVGIGLPSITRLII